MADWDIRRLERTHDRSEFDCRQPILNEWLKTKAGQLDPKGNGG